MRDKKYYFYIMTNEFNTVTYVGVTNDLERRVWEHKNKLADGFTKKYNVNKLVYYEVYDDPTSAIEREKQVKGGSRQKKIALIKKINPQFKDLFSSLFG